MGKEWENSYQKMKRSPKVRHTQHRKTYLKHFDDHRYLSQSEESSDPHL